MNTNQQKEINDWIRLKRIWSYFLSYKLVFFAGVVVTLLFGITETIVPWIMYLLLEPDQVKEWIPASNFYIVLPIMLISVFILRGILGFIRVYWSNWLHHTIARDLRNEMVAKIVRLPKSYYDQETSGILLSRLTQFIDQMLSSVLQFVTLLQDVARIAGYLGTMFFIEWRFALVAIVALPITLYTINLIAKKIRRISGRHAVAISELTGTFSDTIQSHTVVKSFGGQQREIERFRQELSRLRGIGLRQGVAMALNLPLSQLVIAIAIAIILGMLSIALGEGNLSEGEVSTFILAMMLLPLPLRGLSRLAEQVQVSIAASKQVFDLLDSELETTTGTHAPETVKGDVEFNNVKFTYPGDEKEEVLHGLNLNISAGEKIALLGPSGSGKSTITNLLLGFYFANEGTIKIDGVEVKEWSLDALRKQIGIVSQDVNLFNASVVDNVVYPHTGDEIDSKRLEQAIQSAEADKVVDKLPNGLDTVIGERGLELSGGERQRISIARAFYKDAPILILDEATSALDTETEKSIQKTIEQLMQNRTTLIITHRHTFVELASKIVVLERGVVSATGTHTQLLVASPLYKRLHVASQPIADTDKNN